MVHRLAGPVALLAPIVLLMFFGTSELVEQLPLIAACAAVVTIIVIFVEITIKGPRQLKSAEKVVTTKETASTMAEAS